MLHTLPSINGILSILFWQNKAGKHPIFFSPEVEDCHVNTWDAEKAKAAATQIHL